MLFREVVIMTKRRGQNDEHSPAADKGARKRKARAPVPVIVRLHADIAANYQHPLAKLSPATRDAQRQQLIASILARLASGPIQDPEWIAKMTEARPAAEEIDDSPRSE